MTPRPPPDPPGSDALRQTHAHWSELPENCRSAALEALRRAQPELAAELETLLAVDTPAAAWFEQLEQRLGRGRAAELDAAWAPDRIVGPYRLERLLATGGMDAVFVARKADGELQRPVALKLSPPGLISNESIARLRRERDLIAQLSHPHIATLLDAGVSPEGQPWFALELIDGLPLIAWCNDAGLGRRARLELFLDLAGAVAFAHRHLVVHGDLKPSNIMVDRDGRARLLDFGIARLLREIPGAHPSGVYLTPGYAAPEVRAGGGPSVAADIYALGIVLDEMLAAGADAGDGRLPPELRAIIDCATRQEADARYHSVSLLIADLRHYLDGLPVSAYRSAASYRFGKWLRRHPWASGAGVLALIALTAFALISRQQAERYARERDKAEQLAAFMQSVFAQADPEQARGEVLTARELLDRGVALLPAAPADPAARADFLTVMGETYQRLGLYDEAGRLLHQALTLRQTLPEGGLLPRVAARARVADNHVLNGEWEEAEKDYRIALELVHANGEDQDTGGIAAEIMAKLGRTLGERGDAAAGLKLLQQALEATRRRAIEATPELAERLNDLASAHFRLGHYDAALAQLIEALAIRRRLDAKAGHAAGSPRTATLLNNLGLMHYLSGKPADAEPLFKEALELRRRILPPDHPDIAQTLTNLGLLYKDQQRTTEAADMLEAALTIRRRALRPDHIKIAQAQHNLAMVRQQAGDFAQAQSLFESALRRLRDAVGENHPLVAIAYNDYGALFLALGDAVRAERNYRLALAIRRLILPADHPHLAWSLTGLGRALTLLGRPQEAEPLLSEALAIRQKALSAGHPLIAETASALASARGSL